MNGLHHYSIVVRYTVHCPGKDMSLCVTQESSLHWPDIKIALYQSSFPTRLQAPSLRPAFSSFFCAFVHAFPHALNTHSQLSTWPTPPPWPPWSLWLPSLYSHKCLGPISQGVQSHCYAFQAFLPFRRVNCPGSRSLCHSPLYLLFLKSLLLEVILHIFPLFPIDLPTPLRLHHPIVCVHGRDQPMNPPLYFWWPAAAPWRGWT